MPLIKANNRGSSTFSGGCYDVVNIRCSIHTQWLKIRKKASKVYIVVEITEMQEKCDNFWGF